MTVRCSNNATEMYINWNDFLGSDAYTTFRVDKEQASKSNWQLSTDKVAAFYPGSPVPLLKKIAGSSSFVASVTPYNESPVTAVFDTAGASSAFTDIRKGCGW
ncbi:Type VI secretion system VasI, EvfG [compost metagenome]